uniref:Caveolin n=1 Tax=Hucho hucho TaxID=62062 RepID=A0A4W5NPJ1_9TELE
MGLEKVNYETSIIMDEDEFNRSIEPILSKNDKVYEAIPDRDPNDINSHLKVGFDDVIAEPSSSHSFDKVWIGSHAVFELVKYGFYLILTTILAVPMAFILGIVFGVFSCVHIWYEHHMLSCFPMMLGQGPMFPLPVLLPKCFVPLMTERVIYWVSVCTVNLVY